MVVLIFGYNAQLVAAIFIFTWEIFRRITGDDFHISFRLLSDPVMTLHLIVRVYSY